MATPPKARAAATKLAKMDLTPAAKKRAVSVGKKAMPTKVPMKKGK